MKFLKRPGKDLDAIAIEQASKTRFDPARDGWNRPTASFVVWPIEWPSYWWMAARVGTVTRLPKEKPLSRFEPTAVRMPNVPCEGSGPLNLDSIHPVYRDCSMPNLSKGDASEPWIQAVVAK